MSKFHIVTHDGESFSYDINPDSKIITIGRDKSSDIVLNEHRVSRKHAELRKGTLDFFIVDLNSTNGTIVNGSPITRQKIKNGDRIEICASKLFYKDEEETKKSSKVDQEIQPIISSYTTDRILDESIFIKPKTQTANDISSDMEKNNKILYVLYQISWELSRTSDFDKLMNTIMDLIFEIIDADYGFVAVLGENEDELIPKVVKYRNAYSKKQEDFRVSKTIMKKVIGEKTSLLSSNALEDSNLGIAHSIVMQNIRSVMSVPLLRKDDVIGMIQVDSFRLSNQFTKADLDLLSTISSQIGLIIEQAHLNELNRKNQFVRETFGRYLSDEIVNTILESPDGLKVSTERREVTIMMSDLRGFTSLSERLTAEEVVSIINIYLKTMTKIILKYQGTIDEFIGDAILVIFGAPIQRVDDAKRAVACAVEMQNAMTEVNKQCREKGYPEVVQGIGLNTGDVAVGNIGSEERVKYGIVGRNVNLTSRIESYTVGGQIYISEKTLKDCGPILRIDDQVEVVPKGVKKPITIYDIGGIGGDFNIFLPEKAEVDLRKLVESIPVHFHLVSEKSIEKKIHDGRIVKIGKKAAEIHSTISFKKLTNLKFILLDSQGNKITDELYAKVIKNISESPSEFVVQFTSLPPEAERFFETVLSKIIG